MKSIPFTRIIFNFTSFSQNCSPLWCKTTAARTKFHDIFVSPAASVHCSSRRYWYRRHFLFHILPLPRRGHSPRLSAHFSSYEYVRAPRFFSEALLSYFQIGSMGLNYMRTILCGKLYTRQSSVLLITTIRSLPIICSQCKAHILWFIIYHGYQFSDYL